MEMWTKYENFALLFYNASVLELFSLLPLIHLVIYYSSRDGDRNTTKILVALRKALWVFGSFIRIDWKASLSSFEIYCTYTMNYMTKA